MPAETDSTQPVTHRFAAALSIFLSVALVIIDGSIITVALPVIARALHVSDTTSIWLVNVYQMILLAFLFPAISIARKKGSVRLFLGGILLFTAASLACALAQNFVLLMCFRVIQALGGAAILSVNISLVERVFQGKDLARGISLNTATISLSIIIAPGLAGLILINASWPWLFVVNIPLGLATFFAGRLHLPRSAPSEAGAGGHATLSLTLNLFIFISAFLLLSVPAYGLPLCFAPLSALTLAASLFLFRRDQLARQETVYPARLLAVPGFKLTMACLIFCFMTQSGTVLALPFLLMETMRFDIADTSLLLIAWPAVHILASLTFGSLKDRVDPHKFCLAGMLICAAGIVSIIFSEGSATLASMALCISLCGLGFGLFQAPNDTLSMNSVPRELSEHTSAMLAFSRTLGQVLGSLLTAAAFLWNPASATFPFCLTATLALAGTACIIARMGGRN